jgi:1-acyl-sn-glycerol-3-phosphate acyltransferase
MSFSYQQPSVTSPSPLPTSTVQRAQAGLKAAQNPALKQSINRNLEYLEQIGSGKPFPLVRGEIRRLVLRSLIHFLFNIKVENSDYIPKTPIILAGNHLNHIDPFVVLSEVPTSPYCYVLGDSRSLYNKLWKRLILSYSGGVIPVERRWKEENAVIEAAQSNEPALLPLAKAIAKFVPNGSDIKTLRRIDRSINQILNKGESLLLFPEGRLGTEEGQLMLPLKKGTILYSLKSGVPIVPFALIGTKSLYFRKTLTLRLGQPIMLPHVSRPHRHHVKEGLQQLTEGIQALLPESSQDSAKIKLFSHCLNHLFE